MPAKETIAAIIGLISDLSDQPASAESSGKKSPKELGEELHKHINVVFKEIANKDANLQLAAQLGSELATKHEEAEAQLAAKQEEQDKQQQALQDVKILNLKLVKEKKRKEIMLAETEKDLAAMTEEKDVIERQLKAAKSLNKKATSESAQAELSAVGHALELKQQEEHASSVVERLEHDKNALTKALKRDQALLHASTEALKAANVELAALRKSASKGIGVEQERKRATKASKQARSLKWEKQQLATTVRELSAHLEKSQSSRANDSALYQEALTRIHSLRDCVEKMRTEGKCSTSLLSLADELLASLASGVSSALPGVDKAIKPLRKASSSVLASQRVQLATEDVEANVDHTGEPAGLTPEQQLEAKRKEEFKCANLEFFQLTTLAVKINLGQKMDDLYTINTSALWDLAVEQRVEFHQFSQWIESEITKAYFHRLYDAQEHPNKLAPANAQGTSKPKKSTKKKRSKASSKKRKSRKKSRKKRTNFFKKRST